MFSFHATKLYHSIEGGMLIFRKTPPQLLANVEYNYGSVAVEVEEEFPLGRDGLYEVLKKYNVFTRRYFYPLITDLPCYRSLPVTDPLTLARGVTSRILALPAYHDRGLDDVHGICDIVECLAKPL